MAEVFEKAKIVEELVRGLRSELPPVFARRDLPRYLGSSLPVGTLANMGKAGPPFLRHRRHAIYEREAFLSWYIQWLLNGNVSTIKVCK